MKEKLLQAEQPLAKSKHDLTLKAVEAEEIRAEWNKAWIKLDKAESFTVEAERCIDSLRQDVSEASSAWSELEEQVAELVEGTKVVSEKAIEEYKLLEAFKDEVTEGALDMFLFGFDECKKQVGFLYLDLELGKLQREFQDD